MRARYDGLAEWYDERFVDDAEPHQPGLLELLGPGSGRCLDIGCGTGRNFETIRASGRTPVGLDYSIDQLGRARFRTDGPLIHGDAGRLPFAHGSFGTAVTLWTSTDVDDFGAVLLEAARVLRPGGLLVAYGVHPCFNGPHVVYEEDGRRTVHPTYRQSGWHTDLPWWGVDGIRRRIGMSHLTLAEYLNTVLRSGLVVERFEEPAGHDIPHALAFRAHRAA